MTSRQKDQDVNENGGDIIDRGNERMQEILDDSIAAARRGPMGEPGDGWCWNCEAKLARGNKSRWCNIDCRDDWDKIHNA